MNRHHQQHFFRPFACRSASILAVLLLSSLLLTACVVGGASENSPKPTASDTSPSVSIAPDTGDMLNTAGAWAEAVKTRDGKAQYALMTKALQAKVYDEFVGLNWVTGTSSPWVESYVLEETSGGVRVTFDYATSTGPAGSYYQDLSFEKEDGTAKISAISEFKEVTTDSAGTDTVNTSAAPTFPTLIKLLGMTKDQLTAAIPETPTKVDEGGLGFDKTGIRVWFDADTGTKVAQVLILTDKIDINGVKVGGSYDDFKAVFGEPVSDNNGDAHFKYGDIYLSVVRDINSGTVAAVYILAEDF